jgi:uncharacterized protein (DUF433 family)
VTETAPFDRITFDPRVMGGRACVRGTRVTVATVVGLVADGMTPDEIVADYPYLAAEDVRAALAYAAWLAREEVIPA